MQKEQCAYLVNTLDFSKYEQNEKYKKGVSHFDSRQTTEDR